jgi:hypothetical protein
VIDQPTGNPRRHQRWKRVERARAYLESRSHEIVKALIDKAIAGDARSARWLLEHTAATDDQGKELRPIAPSIDKPAGQLEPIDTAPRVLIGINLGADFARLNANQTASELPPLNVRAVRPED